MKKAVPFIIGGLVFLVLVLALMASRSKPVRRLDERITLRRHDKIPYGTAVARHLLPSLFPNAVVYTDNHYPGAWENIDPSKPNQAVILIADYFGADEAELQRLENFVANGNYVFVVTRAFSDETARFFRLHLGAYYNFFAGQQDDSLSVKLERPPFKENTLFAYPGKRYDSHIQQLDSGTTAVLGKAKPGLVNFVQLKKASGRFFLHTSPLAFSNYFILHKQNVVYYQQVLSVIPGKVKAVLWNEYFLEKKRKTPGREDINWLGTLLGYPAFRWGMLTAMFFLLLYVLLGMRRQQRIIPPYQKPNNDSLDFVKTVGRLYFDRGDHHNLAEKMGAYFLEHVRSTYKMATHILDDDFVRILHIKSGYPEPEIRHLVSSIKQLQDWPAISEEKLTRFYQSLELFYQNT